ncbi:hypothetical protein SAMN06265355_101630 [Actinomadura mexicana]|uniref:Uncharacterized protein n=2 Tax=Actinomadura mexicana TaxID=134959 RepID=A0A238UYB2_9ACTN|nr:hypothetical protein SAMN06265355_101630 [Actinomadura mexicana]
MDLEGRLATLRAEFPGWTIDGSEMPGLPYRAVREGGDEKALILGAGTYDALRTLLSQQDAADCERALLTLSKALADRGTEVIEHSVSLVMRTRAGVARSVGALRGRFNWDSGLDLGPIADVDEATVKIVRLLGLEMHPQLAALATRMGIRGYKVDIAAPEVTVTTPAGVSPPRGVRVTCEPRPKDDDRDWFWTHMGDALAPATDVTGAEVGLVGLLAADSGAGGGGDVAR